MRELADGPVISEVTKTYATRSVSGLGVGAAGAWEAS